jgi:hypothetical protein
LAHYVLTSRASATDLLAHATIIFGLSALYAFAFEAVRGVSEPLQAGLGLSQAQASLLFFPHGVRIIAAYLFGWRSVIYLFPAKMFYAVEILQQETLAVQIMTPVLSQVACVGAFTLLAYTGVISRKWTDTVLSWRCLVLAGCAAAALHSTVSGLLFGHDAYVMAKLFVGDISGFIALLLLIMLGFRMFRRKP